MYDDYTHWRDSGRTPKFFMIEAQVFIPILLTLFHFRTWTLMLSIAVAVLLYVLGRYQVSLRVFMINLREWVFGRQKHVEIHEIYE
ncbi:IcmT/TraK family protein [Facilibium subflavum]|uniref:IcmT/TraK family protein n=1 Tax=Facilibium subflavum TaxID=2219058 RepID=UPI000E65108E|nr:IcmT/TraK family protein [Facilibium subflavum]